MLRSQHLILGSTGMIGSQIARSISLVYPMDLIVTLSRRGNSPVRADAQPGDLSHILEKKLPLYVYWCQGPTSPEVDIETQRRFAKDLPLIWVRSLQNRYSLEKFITLGSVHENIPDLCRGNSYLSAKREWFLALSELSLPIRHFQLHTIYGLPLRSSSFAGQMAISVREKRPFRMSKGFQLREYHHAEDIAEVILRTLELKLPQTPETMALSHGNPISLRNLATGVFEQLGLRELLQVGETTSRAEEVFTVNWAATPEPFLPRWRDPVEGLVRLMQ